MSLSLLHFLFQLFLLTLSVPAAQAQSSEIPITTTPSECNLQIPIIDLQSSSPDVLVTQVAKACREIGFLVLTNHNVSSSTIDRAWEAARDFFNAPASFKRQFQTNNETEYPYGYEQNEVLTRGKRKHQQSKMTTTSTTNRDDNEDDVVTNNTPDLKETFSLGPSNPASGMPPRRFPVFDNDDDSTDDAAYRRHGNFHSKEFRLALEEYYREMERLTEKLLQIFAQALEHVPHKHWFQDKMDRHMSALRLLNYFPLKQQQQQRQEQLLVRAGAHTDYGVLTILKTGGPGLQVQDMHNPDHWIDVPHVPDGFVLNLGDLMQRWTNGTYVADERLLVCSRTLLFIHISVERKVFLSVFIYYLIFSSITFSLDEWVSTLHRVVAVPDANGHVSRRQAMAFFVNLNGDAVVTPLSSAPHKYPPIVARDHLMAKHLASMGVVPAAADNDENDEL